METMIIIYFQHKAMNFIGASVPLQDAGMHSFAVSRLLDEAEELERPLIGLFSSVGHGMPRAS